MIYPLNTNKIEKLDLDPINPLEDGYVWFNNIEKSFKSYVNGELQVFITDKSFQQDIGNLVEKELVQHEFTVTFNDAYRVIIKHNKGNRHFNYNVYDTDENCNLPCSLEILNDDEISVEFVDSVTGYIYMYFE